MVGVLTLLQKRVVVSPNLITQIRTLLGTLGMTRRTNRWGREVDTYPNLRKSIIAVYDNGPTVVNVLETTRLCVESCFLALDHLGWLETNFIFLFKNVFNFNFAINVLFFSILII